jgi:ATP dependent DNA ligase C terminal region/ATP dependent DNA ligase domain
MTTHKLVDVDMLAVKQGTYRQGVASALRDPNLLAISRMRRRQASQVMVALDHEGMKTKIPPGPYFISLKIDGEFTVMAYKDGDIISVNPYGTVRMGAPFHIELGRMLAKAGIRSAIIGGELWVKHADGHRPRVHDVTRLARAPQSQADVDQLHYAVFAIYDLDGVDLSTQPGPQLAKIRAIFSGGKHVQPIETHEGSETKIQAHFKKWVIDGGEEGIVARSEKFGWFKIKPRHTLDVAVIGISEAIEDRAGMLHSLLLAVVRGDGSYHVVGRTGGGFSDAERVQLLKDLGQRTAESSYIEVNSDRVAYKMLQPGLVAEISCLDVITEFADGEPIERMVIEWDQPAKKWTSVRRLPLASIISPQFERLRDDKKPCPENTGLTQLSRVVDLPEAETAVANIRLPKAEILKRAVATKELKGKTMVRKLMLWKTNKDAVSAEHPAFVLLLTDYSPNRKTPLEREIRVSSSREQIDALYAAWSTENFVKGWAVR